MAYTTLINDIKAVIKNNGNQEITGQVLQTALVEMVNELGSGYTYKGVATLSTTPDVTTPNIFYLLGAVGTYTNIGGIQHTSGIGIALWNGTAWSYQNVPSAAVVATDATPTANSTNPVQSGGVFTKVNDLTREILGIDEYSISASVGEHPITSDLRPIEYKAGTVLKGRISLGTAVFDGTYLKIALKNSSNQNVLYTNVTIGQDFEVTANSDAVAVGFYIYRITTAGTFNIKLEYGGAIPEINNEIEHFPLKEDVFPFNNPIRGYISYDSTLFFTPNSSANLLLKIPVIQGKKYILCVSGTLISVPYCIWGTTDNNVTGTRFAYTLGENVLTVPADVNYLWVGAVFNNVGSITNFSLNDAIQIDEINNSIESVGEDLGALEKSFDKEESPNIYDGTLLNGYINPSSGNAEATTDARYKMSGLIPVEGNTYYSITLYEISSSKAGRCLNSSNEPIKFFDVNHNNGVGRWSYYITYNTLTKNGIIKTPESAVYLQVNLDLNNGITHPEQMMVEKIGTTYDPETFTPTPYYKQGTFIYNLKEQNMPPEYAELSKSLEKKITAVGSSGFDAMCGGQYQLTNEQKTTYGVTSDLTMAKVMQVLLGYDKVNLCAADGNTASNILFKYGLTSYKFLNSFTLPADKSNVSYIWNTDTISAEMTETLTRLVASHIGTFEGIVNGVNVEVNAVNGTIKLLDDVSDDISIPAGSFITRKPISAINSNNGFVRESVKNSYGLLLQIGANPEGCTPEEIFNYFDLVIKSSNCKWFVCFCSNGTGRLDFSTGDLGRAVGLLQKKYGARYVDHRTYLCSLQALYDQGITPTTSEDYPDKNGQNSNPLTATQIANNVKCDMQCIAEGLFPSSFWHSAYREGEPQTINSTHLNAQGLECWGKFMVKMVELMKF